MKQICHYTTDCAGLGIFVGVIAAVVTAIIDYLMACIIVVIANATGKVPLDELKANFGWFVIVHTIVFCVAFAVLAYDTLDLQFTCIKDSE
jgi:hypothetical protein